jgi:hypothetical protein
MKALKGGNARMNNAGQARDETHPEGLTEFELIAFRDDDIIEHRGDVGWSWDQAKVTRTHPDDPEIHYRIDPATQEVVLSPKLVEQLRWELGRARPGGGR